MGLLHPHDPLFALTREALERLLLWNLTMPSRNKYTEDGLEKWPEHMGQIPTGIFPEIVAEP